MNVAEVFYSLQGEGRFTGVPSAFVRLAGCPVRCPWCDTRYAWDPEAGEPLDTGAVLERIGPWPSRFVVITGGEPMATMDLRPRPELGDLCRGLKAMGFHITVETSGVVFVPGLACDLMSISPKPGFLEARQGGCTQSHLEPVRRLVAQYDHQLKIVVHASTTVAEIQGLLDRLGGLDPRKVMLMPQARTREELLAHSPRVAQMCLDGGWVFSPRLQVLLWDAQRGR
ncbi:MAG: 7-carboxy-7-deazaguanine synthase QueE [Phycisphaerae bacterium]|nr:7-carboxy-7-deazaguanine synthase QueE [Phycisphaerae bacterium]